ncbi:MAG: hypothetical protein ACREQQ_06035 [Candidatus Binatia bacterium]
MSRPLTLAVLLFVDSERVEDFERFEASAVEIMSRYGGAIERRICFPPGEDSSQPRELHVVTFADRDAFDRYRRDPDLARLGDLRARAIRRTVVWQGVEAPPFRR